MVVAVVTASSTALATDTMSDIAVTAVRPVGAPTYADVAFRYGWVRSSFPTVQDAKDATRAFHATRVDWFYPGSHTADVGNTYVSQAGQDFIDWAQDVKGMKIVGAMSTLTNTAAWDSGAPTNGGRYRGDPNNPAYVAEAVNWGKAHVDAGVDAILVDDFFGLPSNSDRQAFNDNVILPIKAYSQTQGYAGGIEIAANNGSFIGTQYVSNYDYDFHYSDNNSTPGPGAMWAASKAHRAEQSAFLMHPNRPMTKTARRSLIGLGYASGAHVITPWDEYTSSAAGGGRLFEDPADFADLYGFARSLGQQGYLNEYEDAAVGGYDLIENRYGAITPIDVTDGSGTLSVFGRAQPGEPNAPVVFHLVESGTAQSALLHLNRDALFGMDNVGFSLLAPTDYDETAHNTAADNGDYLPLSQSSNLSYYLQGDDLVVQLPSLNTEWNTLIATPGAGTPDPAPDPVTGTITYWQLDESSGNLVDVVGSPQTLTGATGLSYGQPIVAPNPVPNPDAGPFTSGTTDDNPSAIDFGGASRGASIADSAFKMTDDSSFTFEGWLQHNIDDGSQEGLEVVGGDRQSSSVAVGGGTFNGWVVWINNGRLTFYAQFGPNESPVTANAGSTTEIDLDSAHHFAAVWDHINGEMRLYIDGVLEGAAAITPGDYTPYAFGLGARAFGDNIFDNNILNGQLDELRFSNEALAPSQFLNAPEPASLALLCLGALLIGRRGRG